MQQVHPIASDNRTVRLDGTRLLELRRERGLTREQLADAADGSHRLSVATLKRAEQSAPIYLETARRIAGLFGVKVHDLVEDSPGEGSKHGEPSVDLGGCEAQVGVAVLPFRSVGPAAESLILAQGLSEDLTTRLGNWWFPVICRGSTHDLRVGADLTATTQQLRVGYFVEGSVQLQEGLVRVQARLIAAPSGEQLWSAEYNRSYSRLFSLQDELINGIVHGVNQRLLQLVSRELARRPPTDLQAWELAVLGGRLFYERTSRANREARELLHKAVKQDPGAAWAFYLLALTYQQEILNQWTPDPTQSLTALSAVSTEFERWHRGDARADVIAGYLLIYRGKREAATDRIQIAVERAPNLSIAYSLLGQTLAMSNEPDRAIEQFELAMRLSPRDADLWSVETATALAHFVAERYEEALKWAERAGELRPDIAFTFGTVAAASALAGDLARGREAIRRMLSLHPTMNARGFSAIMASTRPEIAQRYLHGLRLAGFPA